MSPYHFTHNADSTSEFLKGRALATRLPKRDTTTVLSQPITMINSVLDAVYRGVRVIFGPSTHIYSIARRETFCPCPTPPASPSTVCTIDLAYIKEQGHSGCQKERLMNKVVERDISQGTMRLVAAS